MEIFGFDQSLGPLFVFSAAVGIIIFLIVLLVAIYSFQQRRLRAAVKDAEDLEDLAATRNRYVAEIEQARTWHNDAREELLKLDAEREAQERVRLELQEIELKTGEAEQAADAARKEVTELQYAVTALSEDRDRLTKEIEGVKEDHDKISELSSEKQVAEESARKAKEEVEELQNRLNDLTEELDEAQQRKNSLETQAQALEARQTSLQNEIIRLETEVASGREQLITVEAEVAPIREQRREEMRLETRMKEIRSEIAELEQEKLELQTSRGSEAALAQYADLIEVEPRCLIGDVFPSGDLGQISEEEALKQVALHLESQGLIFSQRVLNAFHTCMKVSDISPITVLAGISGTGKSELPLRYAEAMGMHALSIAVQPSWSSPQDLFGFYNYLEKRYKATELARSLVRMDPYNFSSGDEAFRRVKEESRADRMLLVLIDEMNLARVEYYFSEFLSKLEARRAVLTPENHVSRAPAEIEIEGARQSSDETSSASSGIRLWVGRNVLFAGTMNEDESTQTLSDKVLDRSNVLRFGKPPSSSGIAPERSDQHKRDQFLTQDVWQGWVRPVQDHRWRKEVDEWIENLNDALELIGRPFGWRVREAIRQYIANYPGIDGQNVHKIAMADQVEQKVIPKLRGSDITQSQDALNAVERVLDQLQDGDLSDAFRECKQETMYGTFNWRGVTRS